MRPNFLFTNKTFSLRIESKYNREISWESEKNTRNNICFQCLKLQLKLFYILFSGAFLIPYFIAMLTCGIPLFLLEVSIGQYLGVGGMNVIGQLCPIFKGVGYSAIMMVFLENVYYVIIVAWTMFYIANIFYNMGDDLPWTTCEQGSKSLKKCTYQFFCFFLDEYKSICVWLLRTIFFSSCIIGEYFWNGDFLEIHWEFIFEFIWHTVILEYFNIKE